MDRDRLNGQDIPLNKLDDIEVGDTLKKTLLIYGLFFFTSLHIDTLVFLPRVYTLHKKTCICK